MTPERSCSVCRIKKPKDQLFRFVIDPAGFVFDPAQKKRGRGVYFCSPACWENARSKNRKIKIDSKSPKGKYIGLPDTSWQEMTGDE